jgi:hypothetical protein
MSWKRAVPSASRPIPRQEAIFGAAISNQAPCVA